jgi:hypothetical protein
MHTKTNEQTNRSSVLDVHNFDHHTIKRKKQNAFKLPLGITEDINKQQPSMFQSKYF